MKPGGPGESTDRGDEIRRRASYARVPAVPGRRRIAERSDHVQIGTHCACARGDRGGDSRWERERQQAHARAGCDCFPVMRPTHPEGPDEPIELLIGDDSIPLGVEELDRLVLALTELDDGEAARVADDVTALRLAGGSINLMPTTVDLRVIGIALSVARVREPLSEGLEQVVELCEAALGSG
jgi:hypothetical protein